MANKGRASGEASNVQYDSVYNNEFFCNGRESYRLCVTAVNGKPKINLSKFWYWYQEQDWLPTKQHFFFNLEAWSIFLANVAQINSDIQKLGLSSMLHSYSFTFSSKNFVFGSRIYSIFLDYNQLFMYYRATEWRKLL